MPHAPVLTTVIGSHPFPGWLQHAAAHVADSGPDDLEETARDATTVAIGETR